jgi:hypothetical protein
MTVCDINEYFTATRKHPIKSLKINEEKRKRIICGERDWKEEREERGREGLVSGRKD